jgi:hypothetical protein
MQTPVKSLAVLALKKYDMTGTDTETYSQQNLNATNIQTDTSSIYTDTAPNLTFFHWLADILSYIGIGNSNPSAIVEIQPLHKHHETSQFFLKYTTKCKCLPSHARNRCNDPPKSDGVGIPITPKWAAAIGYSLVSPS